MLYSTGEGSLMSDVLKKIAGLTPPVFVMGGFAEDALLGLSLDRPHKDLDLLVPGGALEGVAAQLEAVGVGEWVVVLADLLGQPLILSGHAALEASGPSGGLEVEIYVAISESAGGFSLEVPAQGPAGRRRIFLPADTFDYPATPLAGLAIQTVSPLALCLLRAASAQTRHTGEKRATDLAMVARLRQAFLSGYHDQQLQPRIEAV
jgi:hypothetical protein